MEQLYNKTNDKDIKPNSRSINTVIYAWSNLVEEEEEGLYAVERADFFLRRMKVLYLNGDVDMKPDQFSYFPVIKAW